MRRIAGSTGRVLLLAVAGVMIAAAALAIGILLFGDFGGTEGRILLTTVLLAVHGALGVPSAILRDRRRLPWLVRAGVALVAAAAALNVAAVWLEPDGETFGKSVGTAWALLVPTVVTSALAAAPRRHRLFVPSTALGYLAGSLLIVALWAEVDDGAFLRALGAVVVLLVLFVALQPLLLRAQRQRVLRPLRLVDETGEAIDVVVAADSPADAAARAIRDAERAGRSVRSIELLPVASAAARAEPGDDVLFRDRDRGGARCGSEAAARRSP